MKKHGYALQGIRMEAAEAIFLQAIKPDPASSTFLPFCISARSMLISERGNRKKISNPDTLSGWFGGDTALVKEFSSPLLKREGTEVSFYPQLLLLFYVPLQQRIHEPEKKIGVWDSSLPWKINLLVSELSRVCFTLNNQSPVKSKYKYVKQTETQSKFSVS